MLELQVPGGASQSSTPSPACAPPSPGHVDPVRQLVEGESSIVDKTHALMFGAVLLIALTVAVSVLATLSASVLERRRDFALMKALGGSSAADAPLPAGNPAARHRRRRSPAGSSALPPPGSSARLNFHTATLPRLQVLPLVVLLNLAIARRGRACSPCAPCAVSNPPHC